MTNIDAIGSTGPTILFSDALISFLESSNVSTSLVTKLQEFFKTEEFETDTIYIDIEDDIGVIADGMENEAIMTSIHKFITTNRSMSLHSLCIYIHRH